MVRFERFLEKNTKARYVTNSLIFPEGLDWLLVGGCIYQPIWNELTGREAFFGIKDFDISYWDDDLTKEKEEKLRKEVIRQLPELEGDIDVVNQARVHLWFEEAFGAPGKPFESLWQAMTTHPFISMCVGVNKSRIYAPYGVDDILGMKLRYNPSTHIPREHVLRKMNKWLLKWPELKVVEESFPEGFLGK